MAPSEDGERAERLTNTLFGAKDGGRHHQERASALTSLRRQIRCCALATIISWVYELIDRQLAKHPRPVMFGSKRVSVFATIGDRMATTLPIESQRYRKWSIIINIIIII